MAVITFLVTLVCFNEDAQVKGSTAQQSNPQYEVITKGLLGTSVFPFSFPARGLALNVRNLIMGPGKAVNVSTPDQTIIEVRGGTVLATLGGSTKEYREGDFFVVDARAQFDLENRGDVTVMRSIAIIGVTGKDTVK